MSGRRRLVDFDSEDDIAGSGAAGLSGDREDEAEFDEEGAGSSAEDDSNEEDEEEVRPAAASRRSKRAASVAARSKLKRSIQASSYSLDDSDGEQQEASDDASAAENDEDEGDENGEEEVEIVHTPKARKRKPEASSSGRRSSSRIPAASARKQARAQRKFDALLADRTARQLKEEKQRRKRQRVIRDDSEEEEDDEEYQESDSGFASERSESPVRLSQTRRRRALNEPPPEKEENNFYDDDDIRNFIVESDEEEDEGEEDGDRHARGRDDNEEEDENEFEADEKRKRRSSSNRNKQRGQGKSEKSRRSRRTVDEDEDEDEDEGEGGESQGDGDEGSDEVYVRSTKKKRARHKYRMIRDSDDDDDEENGSHGRDNGDVDEDGRPLSGPALYAFVNNMREEEELELHHGGGSGTLTKPQAFELYLEMLARAHVEPDFVSELFRRPHDRDNRKYVKARSIVEREICTVRESVFASMAWTKEFHEHLTTRGFYRFSILNDMDAREDYCGACGRSNHTASINVILSGVEYNANRVWIAGRWDEELPEGTLLHTRDEAAQQDRRPWWLKNRGPSTSYDLGKHCFKRTFKYHTLLHYKYRLLLKLAPKLMKANKSVKAVIDDREFVDEELDRFKALLSTKHLEHEEKRSNKESSWGDAESRNLDRLRWLAQQDDSNDEEERGHRSSSSRSNTPARQSTISRWISTGSHTAEHPDRAPEHQDFAADARAARRQAADVVELSSDDDAFVA